MPDDFFVAKGTAAGELFYATAGDLGGDSKSVCLIDSGSGNDKVLVSYGSIYINDRAGKDSVFLYQTGGLASIDDIVLQRVNKANPTIVTFGLANGLFLATKGVENFTFSEGTFHLVKGRLIFKTGDGNIQVLNGSLGDDTITGGALPEHINGLAGNDSLSGLGGDDTLIGGPGNDTLDGGAGNNTAAYNTAKGGVTVNLGLVAARYGPWRLGYASQYSKPDRLEFRRHARRRQQRQHPNWTRWE
jgi:Ca2+-binding RTX toxin-like protein